MLFHREMFFMDEGMIHEKLQRVVLPPRRSTRPVLPGGPKPFGSHCMFCQITVGVLRAMLRYEWARLTGVISRPH